jgi:hypothetical protein
MAEAIITAPGTTEGRCEHHGREEP